MEIESVPELNLPKPSLKFDESASKRSVFDILRKKYVVLTPEEYVRQSFVHWLVTCQGYPLSMMNNEVSLSVNGLRRRCDTLVFDNYGKPWMVVEYKASNVEISQETFDQIVRYNLSLHAKYLVVSNGMNHYCCRINYSTRTYEFLPDIPGYLK